MYDREYTIIISTSKNYIDILNIFFDFYNINFNLNLKIIVVSDNLYVTKKYNNNIIFINKDTSWSERMNFALSKVSTEYILFFFEDFIIKNKVNTNQIDLIYDYILKKKIDYLKLNNSKRKINNIRKINDNISIGEIPNYDLYPLPLQVAFWKKEFFLKTLRYELNPWEFERNIKNKIDLKKFKIFSVYKNQPIEYYERGLVIKGKIALSELKFLNKIDYPIVTSRNKESYFEYFYRENYFINLMRNVKYFFFN